jgi:hypothetical protein
MNFWDEVLVFFGYAVKVVKLVAHNFSRRKFPAWNVVALWRRHRTSAPREKHRRMSLAEHEPVFLVP